ncbi:prenylcysteine lyase [Rhizoctonia solani]|uniref:Prenylcysteine lyase n=1 Tax=Rhizoctonia solani TaxID=456999 RepID=A0A8H8SUG9_9AGAM|nr:prenylcysteine lyase [Rhizoctonia solani]QRW17382.1 prenylcysteine lyase [Rhizoctonia solani]
MFSFFVLVLGSSLLFNEASAVSFKVAVIGAGAGGSSASYWLSLAKQRAAKGINIGVTVFEQDNRIGGRSEVVYPYGDTSYPPIEVGAALFTGGNKNMIRAASEFGLSLTSFGSPTNGTGVWDGSNLVWRTTNNSTADSIRSDQRYQDGSAKTLRLIIPYLTSFAKSYTHSFPSFATIADYSSAVGYTTLSTTTLKSYLTQGCQCDQCRGWHGKFGLWELLQHQNGQLQDFEQFLTRSGASLQLGTKVESIRKIGSKYIIETNKGEGEYDAVIVAAPLPLTKIKFIGTATKPSSFAKVNYVHLHSTTLTTTSPSLLPTYFKVDNSSMLPGTIVTTGEYGSRPEFTGLRYQYTLLRNGVTEHVVKIYSLEKLSNGKLEKLFGKNMVKWVHRQEWEAYPYFPSRSDFPPVKIDERLYYVNAMEALFSTMETEIISSRNVVDILSKELLGSGLCGPTGAKGPITQTYVLGWDC